MKLDARRRRRRDANRSNWQRGARLSAFKRANDLRVDNLGLFGSHEGCFAAIHVHHAVHGALARAEVQWHTGEHAARHHEQ